MYYPCDNFCNCSFRHFGSTVQTNTQTDADERFTPATLTGMSNDNTSANGLQRSMPSIKHQ